MNLGDLIHHLVKGDECGVIEAARLLERYTYDEQIIDALCTVAVQTNSNKVRYALLEVLKHNTGYAYRRFSDDVKRSKNPTIRKNALLNLSLMGCRESKDAVLLGLNDTDPSVRSAAALSNGLYDDREAQEAFEGYFDRLKFQSILESIANRMESLQPQPC